MLKTQVFQVGLLQTNCVLLYDTDGEEAVIVDPGRSIARIKAVVDGLGKKVVAVLITHGHWDHVLDVKKWQDSGAKVYIHKNDADKISTNWNTKGNPLIQVEQTDADVLLEDGQIVDVGKMRFKVIHTPGHSSGSCVFIIDNVMLAGDTLFAGGCGRVDFEDGNATDMRNSLNKLYALDGDYRVIPGHGEETTLSAERANAPFVLGGLI